MSTGCGWEGISQVCATLFGARHVPEPSASAVAVSILRALQQVFDLYLYLIATVRRALRMRPGIDSDLFFRDVPRSQFNS